MVRRKPERQIYPFEKESKQIDEWSHADCQDFCDSHNLPTVRNLVQQYLMEGEDLLALTKYHLRQKEIPEAQVIRFFRQRQPFVPTP